MSTCEPKIGRSVGCKARSKREFDDARVIDVEERDLHLVCERSRREESAPLPWRRPDLPQADAVEFVWEEPRSHERRIRHTLHDLVCTRLVMDEGRDRGGINDENGHPARFSRCRPIAVRGGAEAPAPARAPASG